MATYTREGRFTPVNINSDPSASIAYNQQRLALQAKGSAIVKSQYQKLLDLELTHGDNQEKLNNFFKDANDKLNKNVNIDLSDYNNVQQALNIFDPLSKSPEYESIRLDNQYTKHYKQEIGKAEYYRNKQNKEGSIGTGYSDYNYKELVDNYNKFKSNSGQDIQSWGDQYTYKPYYDYTEEQRKLKDEFLKQPDKWSTEQMDANGTINKITFEGKSADQLQKYLDINLSAKAKDQMLLEGRVESDRLDDDEYSQLLRQNYDTSIKDIDNELTKLDLLKTDKTNKQYTPEQIKQLSLSLNKQKEDYIKNLADLNNPDTLKSISGNKKGIFANYFLNKKIADFSTISANNRVSNEFSSNSAFVQALNRQARLNEFVNEFAQRQQEFNADQTYKYDALANARTVAGINQGLIGMDGKPLNTGSSGLGNGKTIVTNNITDEDQQITREQQEKELQGGINQILQKSLPFVRDAFGEVGTTPFEVSKNYLKEIANISNKLQAGDKQTLDLLHAAPDKLNKQQLAKQRILQNLHDNDLQVVAFSAYNKQKKQTIDIAKQQVLKELKDSGLTIDQINKTLNESEEPGVLHKIFSTGTAIYKHYNKDNVGTFKSFDSLAESLVNNPELADKFKSAMKSGFMRTSGQNLLTIGETFTRGIYNHYLNNDNEQVYNDIDKNIKSVDAVTDKIKNIGTEAQLKINRDLNNSYFSTQNSIEYTKPLDTETSSSKAALSKFNVELQGLLPYLPETDKDFNPTMVTGTRKDNTGVTITYQPSEMKDGKLVATGDPSKTVRIDNSLVALNIDDKRDKVLLGAMSIGDGVTPNLISKGIVPFKYNISTASGNKYSSDESGQGGFVGKVIVGDKSFTLPDVYGRPSDVEKKMNEMSGMITGLLLQDINYDLTQANKKPLTREQRETYIKTPEFKEAFNNKMKDYFESGKIYNTFGVQNPEYDDLQNSFLQFNN